MYGTLSEKTGVNAVKVMLRGTSRGPFKYNEGQQFVDDVVERFSAYRKKVGSGVDIGVEFHGAIQPPTEMSLIKALEPYLPSLVLRKDCTGSGRGRDGGDGAGDACPDCDRRTHFHEVGFREILEKRTASILQPEVCNAGGITGLKIIAGIAETYYSPLAPHNPQGPCSLAASLPTAALIPTS